MRLCYCLLGIKIGIEVHMVSLKAFLRRGIKVRVSDLFCVHLECSCP